MDILSLFVPRAGNEAIADVVACGFTPATG